MVSGIQEEGCVGMFPPQKGGVAVYKISTALQVRHMDINKIRFINSTSNLFVSTVFKIMNAVQSENWVTSQALLYTVLKCLHFLGG